MADQSASPIESSMESKLNSSISPAILFEDDYLICIDKPSGMLSQGSVDPHRPHAISVLQKIRPDLKLFLHHRLDKDTSGLLLLSKSEKANKGLTEIFREHQITKTYVALVKKRASNNMTTSLSSNEWVVKNHLAPVRNQRRQMMRMVVVNKGGWYAETHFQLIQNFSDFLYLRAMPKTGRTHQIRVHLAQDKQPILGDSLYGGKSALAPRLMLHAKRLEFTHPISGKLIQIESPIPKDFLKIID